MILLLIFAFLAGIVTILSPCILPILPIILSSTLGGAENGKSRPVGVVLGFTLSFTFFTLFLSSLVSITGISADILRIFSIIIIGGFGVSLLIPQFQVILERLFSNITRYVPQRQNNKGLSGGLIVGFSLGLLWTPCVGPILASVISLAITGTVTLNTFLITFAYSLGTSIPMFIILISGQKALRDNPWLLRNTANIQKIFGIVMIITSIGIYFNVDRKFQTYILDKFPQYGVGLTQFEDVEPVKKQLDLLNSKNNENQDDMGKALFELNTDKGLKAPELIPGGGWLNSQPLSLNKLKGKVVLIDFWTYSCINCQRTFPYLKDWWSKYKDKGLVIIGVHTPEFEFEKNIENVKQATSDFGLTYPVMQDNNFSTWRAFNNRFWPAKYLIDKDGFIRYTHFGEGDYDKTEKVIQELLNENGAEDVFFNIDNKEYDNFAETRETYLGYSRISNFASNETIAKDKNKVYTASKVLNNHQIAYIGNWIVTEEFANPQQGSTLLLRFTAKEVYLVMRSKEKSSKVNVYLDEKQNYLGTDVNNGSVIVNKDTLYKLINLNQPGTHLLRLEFEDNNVEVFAFTFG